MDQNELSKEIDHILDFYSINLDRDAIKKDIIQLIEKQKQDLVCSIFKGLAHDDRKWNFM